MVSIVLESCYGFPELISLSLVFTMWNVTKSFRKRMKPEITLEEVFQAVLHMDHSHV